jgi:hypothetical protein
MRKLFSVEQVWLNFLRRRSARERQAGNWAFPGTITLDRGEMPCDPLSSAQAESSSPASAPLEQPELSGRGGIGDYFFVMAFSSGGRNTSRTWRVHSGRSSKNRIPLWASDTSPGLGRWPPPTSPTSDMAS